MIDLQRAIVYDIEVFPNFFCIYAEELYSDVGAFLQISEFRDDRQPLFAWFNHLRANNVPMIGFNNLLYDYVVLHEIFLNPQITYAQIYEVSQGIINQNPFGFRKQVWQNERFAPQIDLFKVHHFDNKAKTTSLKALQVNMRSENVVECELPFDQPVTFEQAETVVKPYNIHDVKETKEFAHHSMKALEFRVGMLSKLDGDVMNFNDTKIGAKLLESRLGADLCYDFDGRRRTPRQTPRNRIALNDIIFPYIRFENPEFRRVLDFMRGQVLTPDDLDDPDAPIKTKGALSVVARVGNLDFHFGVGGIHGSVSSQRFEASGGYLIRDIDVASLYPNIAIVNRLAPEHLGERFVQEYAKLPEERKYWQKLKGKKCVEANSMKLAGNGTYGNSNNKFSVLYDPKFTMTITVNGQLLLCMLAEWLLTVPSLQIIQINTDGITYRIHETMEPLAAEVCKRWQEYTLLTLEDANYKRMWIRDVNNYVAESMDGTLKQKGAYWHPGVGDKYAETISEAQPPAWHKDFNPVVVPKAAVAAMVYGIDVATFIQCHADPFDFMCRVKVDRASMLMLGQRELQRTTRYYVAIKGESLAKISPPPKGSKIGDFKRKPKITDAEYNRVMSEIGPGVWDARIHTGNKSRHEMREMSIQAGWKIAECNDARNFDFANLDRSFYVQEAQKLIIS
jgi:hypothetical protein